MSDFEELKEFNLSEDVVKKLQDPDYLRRELAEGKSFQEILNYNEQSMEAFYLAAHTLFQKQAYQQSADAFFFLTNLNPYTPSYWLGLGMSEHLNNQFDAALIAYNMVILTDPSNPLPHYHSANCYKILKDPDKARSSYKKAIEVCDNHPAYESLKAHAKKAAESYFL